MEELINYSYPFERVDDNPKNIKYEFVSKGEKEIPKRVIMMQYELEGLERYYNLGFGNISVSADGEEIISDMTRENNKNDAENVLKTVFCCALDYLSTESNSVLTFYGNTSAKHRLYKMQLNKHLNSIKSCFNVKGGIINNLQLEEDEDGKRPLNGMSLDDIEYEEYNPERSRQYNFITFELNDKMKYISQEED